MKLDGSEQKKMNDVQSWSLNVTDGWIYFASGNNIYKMPANGGAKKRILSENVGLMTIHQKWIYYFNGTKGKLYKATVDGTNKMQITDDIINKFNIAGGYIYYSVNKDDMTSYIYRIDLDGKNKIKIAEGSVGNIISEWIYFYDDYSEYQVPTRVKIDGSSREILHFE